MIDLILNGQGHGKVASSLLEADFNANLLRPILGKDGRTPFILQPVLNEYGMPVMEGQGEARRRKMRMMSVANTGITAAFRKDDWIKMDETILKVSKPRLRFVGDLRGAGLVYNIPEGYGKTVLQYQSMTDITDAEIAMDANRETQADRPSFDLTNLPLPIIHKDFHFSTREIAVSRQGGQGLDLSNAEASARRVSEMAEKLALGKTGTYRYGGGAVYGLTNFPQRMTKVMTPPTDVGWSPETTLDEVLEMKEQSQLQYHYGPWMLYTSSAWDKHLDGDYSKAKGDNTLRDRIKKIDGIAGIRTLDYLGTGYRMVLVQMTSDVIREVIGMEMITVQWEPTPFRVNFKVLCIMVPQFRVDSDGNGGVVDGVAE